METLLIIGLVVVVLLFIGSRSDPNAPLWVRWVGWLLFLLMIGLRACAP